MAWIALSAAGLFEIVGDCNEAVGWLHAAFAIMMKLSTPG
jgi:hypothetical protein